MFITEEQAKTRLNHPENIAKNDSPVRPLHAGGRNIGDKNVPAFIRELAGAAAHVDTAKNVAAAFDISQSQVNQYKVGNTSPQHHSPDLKAKVDKQVSKARDLALDKLMLSLGLLTQDKLEKVNARDASTIAANMARIVEKTTPVVPQNNNLQIVFYAPNLKQEKDYEVITVEPEPNS